MIDLNIIILAAGNSSRMGRPKQTLLFEGKSLLERTILAAREANAEHIVVVIGANRQSFEADVNQLKVTTVFNEDWASGLASSINAGLSAMLDINPAANAVVFAVCDQAFISASVFQSLVKRHQQTGNRIIASEYQNTPGTPVFFQRDFFPAIRKLSGQDGARKLLSLYSTNVDTVPFEQGHIDVDTPEDYERLRLAE